MLGRSRLLFVAAAIALAGVAPWLASSQHERPSHTSTDASVVSADGPEAVLAATPRQTGAESSAPRPFAIGLAVTAASIVLLVGGLLARRAPRRALRTPRWIACGFRAPPAFLSV